jgi:hypothetical protein
MPYASFNGIVWCFPVWEAFLAELQNAATTARQAKRFTS